MNGFHSGASRYSTAVLLAVASLGCASGHLLMPTPNLYHSARGYPESLVPAASRTNRLDLLYVTDRAPESEDGELGYGAERSASAAFGSVTVDIGEETSWEELVRASRVPRRDRKLEVEVRRKNELGRFPPTPRPFTVVDGEPVEDSAVAAEQERAAAAFRAELERRLAVAEDKDVLLYVHGFNNSFDFAASVEAEIWHFLGRRGVPVLYSWPAAHGGLFGYFIDRESGEFTIYHLKELLRLLASVPDVERINILAHSRGTDITTTALRELVIESRAAGKDPREDLKVENLILAAPDLDLDVVEQRLMAEKFGPAFGQITIYTSKADKALEASQTLMSGTRFGRVEIDDLAQGEQDIFREVTNVNFINIEGVDSFIGHGYFRESPAASSDLILILRDGSKPGDPGRPLTWRVLNFWEMPRDYPNTPR